MPNSQTDAIIDAITKEWTDKGMIIEGGWKSFEAVVLHSTTGPAQRSDMRKAFFSGAQHLFSSILGVLDPGEEPTADDMRRMSQISNELDRFEYEILQSLHTEGDRQ